MYKVLPLPLQSHSGVGGPTNDSKHKAEKVGGIPPCGRLVQAILTRLPHKGASPRAGSITWLGVPEDLRAPRAGPSREARARAQPGAHSGHVGAAGYEVLWPQAGLAGGGVEDGGLLLGERGCWSWCRLGWLLVGLGPSRLRSVPPRSPEAAGRPPHTPGVTATGSGNPRGPHSRSARNGRRHH